MRLLELKLQNFRQHRNTSLQFFDGITGILGRNGSGKTTLLEGIAWALYGQKAVQRMDRGKAETVRSRGAGSLQPTEAQLTFELAGQQYTVVRRSNDAALLMGGNKTHTGTEDVTRAVSTLLRMDAQAFFTSFFTGQKDLAFLKDVNSRARQEYIGRLLGYERLTQARELANQEKLAVGREISTLERGLGDPEDIQRRKAEASASLKAARTEGEREARLKVQAEKTLADIEPLKNASEAREKQHAALIADRRVLETQQSAAGERHQRALADTEELGRADEELQSLAPLVKEYEDLKKRHEELAALKNAATERRGLLESIQSNTTDLAAATKRAKELETSFATLNSVLQRIQSAGQRQAAIKSSCEQADSEWRRRKAELETMIKTLQTRRAEEQDHLSQLREAGPDGVCPTCERALEDEFDRVTAQMQERIAAFNVEIALGSEELKSLHAQPASLEALKKELEEVEGALTRARQEEFSARTAGEALKEQRASIADFQKRIQSLEEREARLPAGFDPAEMERARVRGTELKPVRDRARQLEALVSRRSRVEKDLIEQEASLQTITGALNSKQQAISDLAFDASGHARLMESWRQASEQAVAAREAALRAGANLTLAESSFKEREQEEAAYIEREKDLKSRRESLRYLEVLTITFDSFRDNLNSQIRPRLSESASDLMAQITDGRYNEVDLDEDYAPRLFDDGEYKPVISGGEEDILHLAMRLAISQMIADRAGMDLGLLVLDEVFGSLDEGRRENVIGLLQNLKGRFQQILLITHIEAIHDMVDRTVWVDYDRNSGASRVRDALADLEDADSILAAGEPVLALQ